jgi:hypothetical protein
MNQYEFMADSRAGFGLAGERETASDPARKDQVVRHYDLGISPRVKDTREVKGASRREAG